MILSDAKIREYIRSGRIVVDPFDENLIGPASLDVRLGFKFRIFRPERTEIIDIRNYRESLISGEDREDRVVRHYTYSELVELKSPDAYFVIHPNEFVLASVYEYVKLPKDIAAVLHGRSSFARLGLLIHTSAGWVDPGYAGHLTLEIYNVNSMPIKLYPLTPIANLIFMSVEDVEAGYGERGGKYYNEEGASPSLIYRDFMR